MSLLWGQMVQTSPSIVDMLTKNTLQVVHVDSGCSAANCWALDMSFKAVIYPTKADSSLKMVKIDQCAQYCSQHQYMRLCGQQATTGVARVVKSGLVCTILSTASVVWATGLPQSEAKVVNFFDSKADQCEHVHNTVQCSPQHPCVSLHV
eukprot:scaffold117934_cov21-Tisochrysis_lutea.AAC.1